MWMFWNSKPTIWKVQNSQPAGWMWNSEVKARGIPAWSTSAGHVGTTLPLRGDFTELPWSEKQTEKSDRTQSGWDLDWRLDWSQNKNVEKMTQISNPPPISRFCFFHSLFLSLPFLFSLSSLMCWPAVVHSFHLIPWVKQIISPSLFQTTEGVSVHSCFSVCCLWEEKMNNELLSLSRNM